MRPARIGFLVLGLVLAAVLRAGDPMRASTLATRREIAATIQGQLAAFRAHDLRRAYAYGSDALQVELPFPTYAATMRTQYPDVWDNTRAEIGVVHDNGATAWVIVYVISPVGRASYRYNLVKLGRGWRVEGIARHRPTVADEL